LRLRDACALSLLDLALADRALAPSHVFDAVDGYAINIGRHEADNLTNLSTGPVRMASLEAYQLPKLELVGHLSAGVQCGSRRGGFSDRHTGLTLDTEPTPCLRLLAILAQARPHRRLGTQLACARNPAARVDPTLDLGLASLVPDDAAVEHLHLDRCHNLTVLAAHSAAADSRDVESTVRLCGRLDGRAASGNDRVRRARDWREWQVELLQIAWRTCDETKRMTDLDNAPLLRWVDIVRSKLVGQRNREQFGR
jgi:hypothetical protein